MTRLESAISYFTKNNKSPKGSLQKIYAYKLAEQALRDADSIRGVMDELMQDMTHPFDACRRIEAILKDSR